MVQNIHTGNYQKWAETPVSTEEEVKAPKAALKFSASTTLSEKISRVFNALMFGAAGASYLGYIPQVATAASALSFKVAATLSGMTLIEAPVILAVMTVAYKILVVVAVIVVIRKVAAVVLNKIVYPASGGNKNDYARWNVFNGLNGKGYECRRVSLNKSGLDYDAFAAESKVTKGNGNWVIVAGGNGWEGEQYAFNEQAQFFAARGFNVLYVNGPGVSRSEGYPTRYSMGAAQESGLQFLEKEVGAKKILIYGTSLGGGADAEAILNHAEFKEDINYMVWGDRSFDTLSNAASKMVTEVARPAFFAAGVELNGVAGAKRLQELGITHIITQNSFGPNEEGVLPLEGEIIEKGHDGVIPNAASLYVGMRKAGINDADRVKCYGNRNVDHNGPLPKVIQDLVDADIKKFLAEAV